MSAIQKDVQNEQQEATEQQRPLTPREQAMNGIMSHRLDQFEQESGVTLERETPKPAADPDADLGDAEAEAERQRIAAAASETEEEEQVEKPAAAPEAQPEDILNRKVKVKVNGAEEEVSIADMQRVYQKNTAADRRLEEASRRERELAAREAQLNAQLEATKAPAQKGADATMGDAEAKKVFTEALFDGDGEKAMAAFDSAVAAAVEKATQGRPNAIPDIDEITATVEQRFAVNSALAKSKQDYPEMYSDPDIEMLAASKIKRLREEDGLSFTEALDQVGGELASKFGWKAQKGVKATTETTTRDHKMAHKKALDHVEAANVKSTTTEAPPLTHAQIIANMAKSRPGYSG